MLGPKKKDFEDPVNAKIQSKFDMIFTQDSSSEHISSEFSDDLNNFEEEEDFNLDGDISMSNGVLKKPDSEINRPSLNLDIDETGTNIEFTDSGAEASEAVSDSTSKESIKLAIVPDDNGLGYELDFGDDFQEVPLIPDTPSAQGTEEDGHSDSHFELNLGTEGDAVESADPTIELDTMFDEVIADSQNYMAPEGTLKTIIYDKSQLTDIGTDQVLESTGSTVSSVDLMSTEEAKANIDATIKGILRPKNLDSTQEIDLATMSEADDFSDFEFDNSKSVPSVKTSYSSEAATGEFDLSSVDFTENETPKEILQENIRIDNVIQSPPARPNLEHVSYVSDEESTRVQATIRQLREEREDLLIQIKNLKGENREREQDNLTLKAALDESKIEVSILRKRHMVELEDVKYRLSLNEEKKAMAIEQARLAESKREKLEQRVRIDFNQVKQREKELETKLEMLSIDVDSQVQSRDQKILELRRKIDSLEFNMENVSIKEQKSEDDKRKLEDKLNKIMKTLRHSIKNLEDDIDQANDEAQDDGNGKDHRSGKSIKYE